MQCSRKKAISCRIRSVTAKKYTKKRDARAESFCLPYSTYCYFDVAFAVAVAVVGLNFFRSFHVVLGGDFR